MNKSKYPPALLVDTYLKDLSQITNAILDQRGVLPSELTDNALQQQFPAKVRGIFTYKTQGAAFIDFLIDRQSTIILSFKLSEPVSQAELKSLFWLEIEKYRRKKNLDISDAELVKVMALYFGKTGEA